MLEVQSSAGSRPHLLIVWNNTQKTIVGFRTRELSFLNYCKLCIFSYFLPLGEFIPAQTSERVSFMLNFWVLSLKISGIMPSKLDIKLSRARLFLL